MADKEIDAMMKSPEENGEKTQKKMLFAINPIAGQGQGAAHFCNVCAGFVGAGYRVEVFVTHERRELARLFRDRACEFDMLVCCGGDGTLNEAVNGIVASGNETAVLGYIPTGTVNDFATSLKIPKNIPGAVKVICDGKPFVCDLAKFNKRCYTYVAAFGAFTQMSYSTSQWKKMVFNKAAYIFDGIKSISSLKSIHARVSAMNGNVSVELEDDFIYGMLSNSLSVGGFRLPNADVSMSDGKLEAIFVKMPQSVAELENIVATLLSGSFDSPYIYSFKADSVKVTFDCKIPWTVDGEYGGSVLEADIKALPAAVRVLTPDGKARG